MFVLKKDTVQEVVGEGVTRRILAHDGSLMSVEVSFEAGAVGPMHCHPHNADVRPVRRVQLHDRR